MKQTWKRTAVAAACLAALSGAFIAGRARAVGVPAVGALTYAGALENAAGEPITGEHNLEVEFWSAETAGTELCATEAVADLGAQGRFSVPLLDTCVAAVRASPNVWVQVLVDGARLPRTKLGSVPYALEAGHASTTGLDTAGTRQRICSGATPAATTAWQVYAAGPNIFVDVDTTRCGFTKVPRYFTSLGGNTSHWTTMGATSIYSATNTGFRIHIDAVQDMTPDLARMQQWHIQWMAVGE